MGRSGFENRVESLLKNARLSWTIRSQFQGTGRIAISTNTTKNRDSLVATLVEDMELLLVIKFELEHRNKSQLLAYFENFGISKVRYEENFNGLIFH